MFVLKTDDDIFVDIFQVVEVLQDELIAINATYACLNMAGNKPVREPNSKWFVSNELYPAEEYPEFCSGSSYLMKANGAINIYNVSNRTNFFWIDDVFVTGILRSKYKELTDNDAKSTGTLEILNLYNRHHLGDKHEIVDWCSKGMETNQLAFTFILLNENEFISEMFCIWNKVRLMRYAMNIAVNER